RYEDALVDFNRAIELKPDDEWTIANRGETHRLLRRYEEALVDLNRAIELKPDDEWAIASRGETYRLLGRYEKALVDLNHVIELVSKNDWRFYSRALTYQALGRISEAQTDFTAAIQIARQNYEKSLQDWRNTFNLALYHLAAGETEEAKHFYQEALSRGALPVYIQEAIQDLDDFLVLFPDHAPAKTMREMLQAHIQRE
ncbi:MAG: tetratricopeptide repeat protein, partial [Nitrospira sp.]|nr:tetratricopeptide repeat protein [Nitrospira sp.]